MVPAVASFLGQRVFCILPSDDPADSAGRRVSAREFGKWVRELPRLMAREEPVGVPPALANIAAANGVAAMESSSKSSLIFPPSSLSKQISEEAPLSPSPVSPTSPSSTLLAQSLAAVLAQQEAAAVAGSSSPAWRHKRGLSNASVGYALSSVPQSRRPASRNQSFSAERGPVGPSSSHLGLHGLGSAAGSRAATPLLRGRALNNAASGVGSRSRVPSYCETPSAQAIGSGVSELPTVFDEGEGDLSNAYLGLELQLEPGRERESRAVFEKEEYVEDRERSRTRDASRGAEREPSAEGLHDHDAEHDAEHEGDDDLATNPALSRSTSMVRKRKRGARRGKGAIIQQQQMEIARLQMQQEELTRQVMLMQEQLAQAQTTQPSQQRGKSSERPNLNLQTQAQVQVLASLNPTPTSTAAPKSALSPSLSHVPQIPMTGGDVLDSLASASEALARELSRAKNPRSGAQQGGQQSLLSSPLLAPMRAAAISGGTRDNSPARSSISHTLTQNSNSRSGSIRAGSTSTSGLTQQASPSAAMALSGAGGPTPGAMFPVSFASSSLSIASRSSQGKARESATSSSASAKIEAGNAHTGAAAGASASTGSVGAGSATGSGSGAPVQAAPAPAIAKKTSKWKLSFGKGSSSSSSHSRAALPTPFTAPVPEQRSEVVLDISKEENVSVNVGKADETGADASQSTNATVDIHRSEAGSAQQYGASASSTASRVKNVLMSLDADLNPTGAMGHFSKANASPVAIGNGNGEQWSRGRRPAGNQPQQHPWNASSSPSNESRWPAVERERNVSPNSTRTGRSGNLSPPSNGVLSSSASSLSNSSSNKSNWRYSTLTTSSATSGWTRYSGSNASMRSVSTVATSVSGASGTGSWRTGGNVNRSDASLASSVEGGRKPAHYVPGGHAGPGSIASRKSDKSSMSGMPPPNVKSAFCSGPIYMIL